MFMTNGNERRLRKISETRSAYFVFAIKLAKYSRRRNYLVLNTFLQTDNIKGKKRKHSGKEEVLSQKEI